MPVVRRCFENSRPSVPEGDRIAPWLTSGKSGWWSPVLALIPSQVGIREDEVFEPRDNLVPSIVIMLLRMIMRMRAGSGVACARPWDRARMHLCGCVVVALERERGEADNGRVSWWISTHRPMEDTHSCCCCVQATASEFKMYRTTGDRDHFLLRSE